MEASAESRELARDFVRLGLAAAAEDRWEDARVAFDRAYDLAPTARVAFNLGQAEVHTGHLVRALDHLRCFVRESEDADAILDEARRTVADLENRVGSVRIEAAGLLEDDELQLDGERVPHAVVGAAMPVDPGPHLIAVMRSDGEVARAEFTAEAGVEASASLVVPPPPPDPEILALPPAPPEDIAESPWLWTGLGLGALAIGGLTVGLVVGLSHEQELMPVGAFVDFR